ncbi:hypothetical protein [Stenotrophomonas sp.]|uniref:hypothetical protein n=1 Tax=Stenotrophomonas sp. TaxID=69392 RepID=UPI00289F392D|nr:hypothetical protein [Stenotrophomonas sp.]
MSVRGTGWAISAISALFGGSGEVRLAPLYDISSALPYPQLQKRKLKLAMKVGSHYRWWDITLNDWRATATAIRLDVDEALTVIASMCLHLPGVAEQQRDLMVSEGIDHSVLDQLLAEISSSCQRCLRQFDAGH